MYHEMEKTCLSNNTDFNNIMNGATKNNQALLLSMWVYKPFVMSAEWKGPLKCDVLLYTEYIADS